MAYNRTRWQDHVTQYSNRYNETNNADGSITHTPVEGTIIQQGTPQNAANFNNSEDGIADAHTATGVWLQHWIQFKQWLAATFAAATGRISTLESDDTPEVKTVTLTNNEKWPFNSSQQTVNITTNRPTTNYTVDAEVKAAAGGTVQGIKISDRLANGFKIAFEGDATSATLKIIIKGGIAR